jgi:two-component system cell cycle response regulator DivK
MRRRILVVEDDESFRALAVKVLTKRGFDVTAARTGSTGVERALADATDLVLMDLRLPELDGWEATRRIKATKPKLPIVACSANVMQADIDRAEEAGCDAFLAKPYQVADLITVVSRFLH